MEMTTEINKLKQWFDKNKLSINFKKTKMMLFGNWKTDIQLQIKIDNINIERMYETEFLGVILDHKISWKSQICHIQSKMARSIAAMGKSRHTLDHKTLHILYCSLVLPCLNYCVEVWGNTYNSSLYILHILQKKAIRIVHNVGYGEHTNCF